VARTEELANRNLRELTVDDMDCARLNQAVYFFQGDLPRVVKSKTYTDLSFYDEIESAKLHLTGNLTALEDEGGAQGSLDTFFVKGGALEVVRNDGDSKTLYIAFKGTSSPNEWLKNFKSVKASAQDMFGAGVASGFFEIYAGLVDKITGSKG
jgi:hypothetical protein